MGVIDRRAIRFWWVNQNKTYRHEVDGGYLWSPKRKSNNARNPYYDFMREVAPGDVVFSYSDTFVKAVGIAASHAYEAPKPLEFGRAGAVWNKIGWRVDVNYIELQSPIRPADHMRTLAPRLPAKFAPLLADGRGLQNIYLTCLTRPFVEELVALLGEPARRVIGGLSIADQSTVEKGLIGQLEWEEHLRSRLDDDPSLTETERQAVILSRRGQGRFKQNVLEFEKRCRVTGVEKLEHLRASHCKPWRDSDNSERLDGNNGLLLTPSVDHLFDRGYIGFEENGDLIVSPVADGYSLARMGVPTNESINVGAFRDSQQEYLAFHRENILLKSAYLSGQAAN